MEAIRNQLSYLNFSELAPSKWGDQLLRFSIADSDFDVLTREIEVLKPKVRENMLMLSSRDNDVMKKKIVFIHFLESLGLSYLFEKEIEETLKHVFENREDLIADENDLYTVSIIFRVFRTYGHNISSDVFSKFKGQDGKFRETIIEDVKGMLSLYEAVHFRTTKDHILDEALRFTVEHLEPLAHGLTTTPPHLLKHIKNSLYIPQHMKSPGLVAIEYLPVYEQEEDRDETLLKLAKLNFKLMQLHYLQELKTIIMWYRGLDHTTNLPPNFRERTFEAWFTGFSMYFEPRFSLGRVMTAKLCLVMTFLDDLCDTYCSISEVEGLINCLERWDPDYMENLQGHMMVAFKLVMKLYKEFEEILRLKGRLFVLEKMIEEFKVLARSNLDLIKWGRSDHKPHFDEYIEVGGVEAGAYAIIACSIMGNEEMGAKEDFDWLMTRPKLARNIATKTRLMDDVTDFEEDMGKGYTANALNYYMSLNGVNKEEATKEFYKMIEDINKAVNEDVLELTNISRPVLMQVVNFGRFLNVLYASDDVYNHREGKFSEYLNALLINPFGF